jgi:hypothetical protein
MAQSGELHALNECPFKHHRQYVFITDAFTFPFDFASPWRSPQTRIPAPPPGSPDSGLLSLALPS